MKYQCLSIFGASPIQPLPWAAKEQLRNAQVLGGVSGHFASELGPIFSRETI